MKKTREITNKRQTTSVQITEDMRRAMLIHSRTIPGCPRPYVGSVSYYIWTAVLERLKKDGCDLAKIDGVYKSIG